MSTPGKEDEQPASDASPESFEAPRASHDPRPRNIEAEQAVLGSMMLESDAVATVLAILGPDSFYRPAHSVIFMAVVSLYEDGEPTDAIATMARLQRNGELIKVGGAPYLHTLCSSVFTTANVGYWAKIVRDMHDKSRVLDLLPTIEQAVREAGDVEQLQEQVRAAVEQATTSRETTESGVWVGDIIGDHLASWEDDEEDEPGRVWWPYVDVNDVTNGMRPGQVILLAARPGVGKSTVGMDCARFAASHDISTLFVSLEMTRGELLMRLASAEAGVRFADVKAKALDAHDRFKMRGAAERIAQLPLRIEDRYGMTLGQLRATAREMKRGPSGLGFLVLDYIQLLTAADQRADRRVQVDTFSRGMKQLAKELDVPMMVIAQLNRGSESRTDKKPLMSDLRESGALEQDPDVVVLIHRPDAIEKEERAGEVDLIFAKHRGGPTGTITVAHQLHYCRLRDLARATPPEERKDIA